MLGCITGSLYKQALTTIDAVATKDGENIPIFPSVTAHFHPFPGEYSTSPCTCQVDSIHIRSEYLSCVSKTVTLTSTSTAVHIESNSTFCGTFPSRTHSALYWSETRQTSFLQKFPVNDAILTRRYIAPGRTADACHNGSPRPSRVQ